MITIKANDGVGIHTNYVIRQDGKRVATMRRFSSRSGWTIYSAYYDEHLAYGGKNIDDAKAKALALTYPTAAEVYETICQRTEEERRRYMENQNAREFGQLARDLAAGSNSAQDGLIALANEIETYAKDRSDTARAELVDGTYLHRSSKEPSYPEPPETTEIK